MPRIRSFFAFPLAVATVAAALVAPFGPLAPLQPAHAQEAQVGSGFVTDAPALHEMLDAIGIYQLMEVVSAENIAASEGLEGDLIPPQPDGRWMAVTNQIYAVERVTSLFEANFNQEALTSEQVVAVTAFFTSEPGRSLARDELATRVAFLDDAVYDAAVAGFEAAVAEGNPRLDLLRRFSEVNGFIERNVSGALNGQFAFFRGLADGGAFAAELTEEMMLAQVWGQEPEVRRTTIEWLFTFQLAAYAQSSDADLEAYIAFSQTDAGQAMNAALFDAFNAMLDQLSYESGRAAGGFMGSDEI